MNLLMQRIVLAFTTICVALADNTTVQMLGNPIVAPGESFQPQSSPVTFMIDNFAASNRSGILIGFSAYFVQQSPVALQLWRPVPNRVNGFSLIFHTKRTPASASGRDDVTIASLGVQCVMVQAGDMVGMGVASLPPPIAMTLSPSPSTKLYSADTRSIGTAIQLPPPINSPLDLSLAAWIETDPSIINASSPDSNGNVNCPPSSTIPSWNSPPGFSTPSSPPPSSTTSQLPGQNQTTTSSSTTSAQGQSRTNSTTSGQGTSSNSNTSSSTTTLPLSSTVSRAASGISTVAQITPLVAAVIGRLTANRR